MSILPFACGADRCCALGCPTGGSDTVVATECGGAGRRPQRCTQPSVHSTWRASTWRMGSGDMAWVSVCVWRCVCLGGRCVLLLEASGPSFWTELLEACAGALGLYKSERFAPCWTDHTYGFTAPHGTRQRFFLCKASYGAVESMCDEAPSRIPPRRRAAPTRPHTAHAVRRCSRSRWTLLRPPWDHHNRYVSNIQSAKGRTDSP